MISVCLTTYNGQSFIKKQLESILLQLSAGDEILVFDDVSSDSTVQIITEFNDSRIKLIVNEENLGYTRNFEKAISCANGDIIFLCDQDDIWLPNKVSIMSEYLKRYSFVVSDAKVINTNDDIISESFYLARKPYKNKLGNLFKFGYLGCCMAFRREILEKALPFPANKELATHDNWLFLVGQWYGSLLCIDNQLILYRRHQSNTSSGGLKKTSSIFFMIKYRLYLIYNLLLIKFRN